MKPSLIPIDIVSVLDYDLYEDDRFSKYQHYQVKIDDDPNENLLQHFSETNAFIDAALKDGKGRVFVHCAMGKSRSATVVCAYLMFKFGVSPSKSLEQLCDGRPVCEPNPGFMEQLKVFEKMLEARDDGERERVYRHWIETRYTGTWYSGESDLGRCSWCCLSFKSLVEALVIEFVEIWKSSMLDHYRVGSLEAMVSRDQPLSRLSLVGFTNWLCIIVPPRKIPERSKWYLRPHLTY